jgi:hypothetical protein
MNDPRFFEKVCALSFPVFLILAFIALVIVEIFFK